MGKFEIDVFNDTRKKSLSIYRNETNTMIQETRVFYEPKKLDVNDIRRRTAITFRTCGTVEAGLDAKKDHNVVAVLNFADALTAGGLVLQGETTQEEGLCRCSNLYESLISCKDSYYEYNRMRMNHGVYTDTIIYTKDALFFKNDHVYEPITPRYIDVISCPSPSCRFKHKSDARNVFINRIIGIMNVANINDVDCLVLGAWGCGAFGQDAFLVGECFGSVLRRTHYFKTVIFAIKHVNNGLDDNNYSNFLKGFKSVYKGDIKEIK